MFEKMKIPSLNLANTTEMKPSPSSKATPSTIVDQQKESRRSDIGVSNQLLKIKYVQKSGELNNLTSTRNTLPNRVTQRNYGTSQLKLLISGARLTNISPSQGLKKVTFPTSTKNR